MSAPKCKKKEKEIVVVVFTASIKRSRRSRAMTAKMCSKSVLHVQSCYAHGRGICLSAANESTLNLLPLFAVFVAVSNSVVVAKVTNLFAFTNRRERLKQSQVQCNFLFLLWLTFVAVPRSFLRCP